MNYYVNTIISIGVRWISHLGFFIGNLLAELPPFFTIYTFFIFVFLFTYATIRLVHPFWSVQPVYHGYDLWRKFAIHPYIIQKHAPVKTKYYIHDAIVTIPYSLISEEYESKLINMIQCNYLLDDSMLFFMNKALLRDLFAGHVKDSLVSIYFEKKYKVNTIPTNVVDGIESNAVSYDLVPIACMVSVPVHYYHKKVRDNEPITPLNTHKHVAYYWDYMCIDPLYRPKKLHRYLMQTHEYNQRTKHPDIQVSMFHVIGDALNGIVPLTSIEVLSYSVNELATTMFVSSLPSEMQVVRIQKKNIDLLLDYLKLLETSDIFEFSIIPSTSFIIEGVKNQLYYVYCLMLHEQVMGLYFFKDSFTAHEDYGNILQLIACYNNIGSEENKNGNTQNQETFIVGFSEALHNIIKYSGKPFGIIQFETAKLNQFVDKNTYTPIVPFATHMKHVYLYNYMYPGTPLQPTDVFRL